MQTRDERIAVIAGNLRVDAATAEVLRALTVAGVESVLLKGPSLARWLYSAEDPRPYRDCDVLVRPDQLDPTTSVLEQLGFVRVSDDRELPAWWRGHAVEWRRADDGIAVDLHTMLPGVGVEHAAAWDILTSTTEYVSVANQPARVLGFPARALHVALHAAQHGVDVGRPLADLDRAVERLDDALWRDAVEVAERLDAVPALNVGLRLTARGRALADRLELTAVPSVAALLQAASAPPVALGLEQLATAGSLRARLEILRAKLAPPPSFIRRWHPAASRSRWGLVLAYMYRPVWILRSTPRAVAAWRRARRVRREA